MGRTRFIISPGRLQVKRSFSKLGCVDKPVPVSEPSPPFPGACALFKIGKTEHIGHKAFLPFINSRNSQYVSSILSSSSKQQMSVIFHPIPKKIIVHQPTVPSSEDSQICRCNLLAVCDLFIKEWYKYFFRSSRLTFHHSFICDSYSIRTFPDCLSIFRIFFWNLFLCRALFRNFFCLPGFFLINGSSRYL